jgi:hypothetical protein
MKNALTVGLVAITTLVVGVGCEPVASAPGVDAPTLADLDVGEGALGLVDRSAALAGAVEAEAASAGGALSVRGAGAGFNLNFTGEGMVEAGGGDRDAAPSYQNVWAGVAAVQFSEGVRHAVVDPPALAIAVAANGTITQVSYNVWLAENVVALPEGLVTTHLTAAWVGNGWLAEMRLSGQGFDHALWFNGFLSEDAAIGWWDLYELGGAKVGVVEWIADGDGNGTFGMAAVAGEHAGSAFQYSFTEDFDRIDAWDGATGEHAWVQANPDDSGEVRLVDFNGGAASCWSTDLRDAACAE